MRFSTSHKSFTLVEMLIVIVIIGILAAALIPKILSVQARARDSKRKIDINQISTALAVYKSDYATLVALSGYYNSDDLKRPLVSSGSYMSSMPKDPVNTAWEGTAHALGVELATGNYAFSTLQRNGKISSAFGLMARMESRPLSNRVSILNGFLIENLYIENDTAYYESQPSCGLILPEQQGFGFVGTTGLCLAAGTELRYLSIQ